MIVEVRRTCYAGYCYVISIGSMPVYSKAGFSTPEDAQHAADAIVNKK